MTCRCLWTLLVAACAVAYASGQGVPFVLPWNDASAGVTDFSALNPPLSASSRLTVDAAGHFAANGRRVRFLGLNFAGDSPFMPTNKAEAVAARLAKFGVNNVRFHHMDASWASGGGLLAYTSTKSTNFNASQLERVHYLVSRLKAHGIYSDINLLVGREYRSGDGLGAEVTTMDWKDAHILGFFNDTALALHKDYATKLLTPTNRFTGLPLAKDPAVAFLEIINENGIIQKWLDGGLDRLPTNYVAQLQSRWNDWLVARYTNEAAMLAAWNIINQPLGTNFLKNGAFTNGLANWNTEQHVDARATFSRTFDFTNARPSAQIVVTQAGSVSWYVQLNQPGLRITNQQPYTVSFWAKASAATNFDYSVMRAYGDYANVGCAQTVSLTTNWQQFTNTFLASVTDTNVRVNFGGMGNKPGAFWVAEVAFQAGGQLGTLPAGASLAARTIPTLRFSGTGFAGTSSARKDWLRFLRDLENRYYDLMLAHVRTNCGYTGLIFGTIMANSPATVQSRLDVIDGHAYWQHPHFPGAPWDPVNWYVPNISMVNTLGDDNTLAGLARQRIRGKPFTVTEYNHPQPNYYGAEAPLLLAAYGGLQDWDGVWMFDYGPGNDSVTMGYVRSYFDTAQNPGKMANLLLAANLFRRGDVRPANQEVTVGISPDQEIDLMAKTWAWGVFPSSQLGVSGKLAFTNRLSVAVGTNTFPNPPAAPTATTLASDTGELRWNLANAGQGIVTVNTPLTKAVLGFATNGVFTLGDVTLRPATNRLGWCSLGATLTRGNSFTNDCTALIVASGWWENTGQVWKSSAKDSVGNQWGTAPTLMEVVPFTLTLPVGTNRVQVWSLDPRGQRLAALPLTGDARTSTLTVGTNAASIWYELEVKPYLTSYQIWQQTNFTSSELTNALISGDSATPAGDGVPNLFKYLFGLPAKTPAPTDRLPFGSLLPLSNQLHLAMTYQRDKSATDVTCVGEVSTDLRNWHSGPAYTTELTDGNPGATERVTAFDLAPVGAANQRYLRLRLSRP